MVASYIRKGEHRIGSASHGRTHTAYSRYSRIDSNGRAQKSQEEADGWQTFLPQESQHRASVR